MIEWDWTTPTSAADHTCLLVVTDSASDPIPASSKIFDVGMLVQNEKRVGSKNLHVINAVPGTMSTSMLQFFSSRGTADVIRLLPRQCRRLGSGIHLAARSDQPVGNCAQRSRLGEPSAKSGHAHGASGDTEISSQAWTRRACSR